MAWNPFQKGNPHPQRPAHPENPGRGVELRVAFARDDRSWFEKAHMVKELHATLRKAGHSFQQTPHSLTDPETGLVLQPQVVGFDLTESGAVQTTTTIEVSHPEKLTQGVFEFQHATSDTLVDALQSGFEQWTAIDLPVLRDAFLPEPRECMELPLDNVSLPPGRRVLVGPVISYAQNQIELSEDEHPPFCTCCFYNNTSDVFKDLLADDQFHAIRYFAMREVDCSSDCRVNGLDHDAGKQALIDYASRWPDRGMEFRKQMVVIQTV